MSRTRPANFTCMKRKTVYYIAGGVALLLLLLPAVSLANTSAVQNVSQILQVTDWLIPQFEQFKSSPYWDVSRWSWGYGTQAPGPTGIITRDQALQDMRTVVNDNYNYLSEVITRPLNANQWGALMSFTYNEGEGNGDNLVDDINAGNDAVLEPHWKKYIYAGGKINSDLVARRNSEWQLWVS